MFNIFRKDKLYKFVFDRTGGYSFERKECTLLVTAKAPTEAVKKLYEMTGNQVRTITEFTEIKYIDGGDKL